MRQPAALALAALLAARAARGDYILQRSWTGSSTCGGGGGASPTFSYADESSVKFNQCQVSSDSTYSFMYTCYNATHYQANAWNTLTCAGASQPGYPSVGPLAVTTAGCLADPGGSGGSTQTSCVISASPYTPPASEPNVAMLYPPASPPCSGAPLYTASSSAAGVLPACAAIAPVFASPSGQTFVSIAYSTACSAAGVPTATGFAYYNTSATCTGATSVSTSPVSIGTCVAVGTNVYWQQNASVCASGSANAAVSADISGGAIAGIIIGVLAVAGAVAAAFFLGAFSSGGRSRTKKAINSTSKSNPIAEAHL